MSGYFIKPIVKTLMLKGQAGQSIKGIRKTSTSGLKDTYTITLTDGTTSTFTVTNGKEISSIKKTGTIGLVDTYTIKFNDDTTSTFTVTNGESDYKPAVDALEKRIDAMFPIGSVYITVADTNPSTFLKGTWEQFGQGRTLIGEGTGDDGTDSQTFTANSTGGEYKHKLTVDEMPSHNHSRDTMPSSHEASGYGLALNGPGFCDRVMVSGNGDTGNKGGDASHNNVQPYITVYFWKRTA